MSRRRVSLSGLDRAAGGGDVRQLRAWLEHVVATAIDWLDALDAAGEDREDDEREIYLEEDRA